jgi:hypothetical protein
MQAYSRGHTYKKQSRILHNSSILVPHYRILQINVVATESCCGRMTTTRDQTLSHQLNGQHHSQMAKRYQREREREETSGSPELRRGGHHCHGCRRLDWRITGQQTTSQITHTGNIKENLSVFSPSGGSNFLQLTDLPWHRLVRHPHHQVRPGHSLGREKEQD